MHSRKTKNILKSIPRKTRNILKPHAKFMEFLMELEKEDN